MICDNFEGLSTIVRGRRVRGGGGHDGPPTANPAPLGAMSMAESPKGAHGGKVVGGRRRPLSQRMGRLTEKGRQRLTLRLIYRSRKAGERALGPHHSFLGCPSLRVLSCERAGINRDCIAHGANAAPVLRAPTIAYRVKQSGRGRPVPHWARLIRDDLRKNGRPLSRRGDGRAGRMCARP